MAPKQKRPPKLIPPTQQDIDKFYGTCRLWMDVNRPHNVVDFIGHVYSHLKEPPVGFFRWLQSNPEAYEPLLVFAMYGFMHTLKQFDTERPGLINESPWQPISKISPEDQELEFLTTDKKVVKGIRKRDMIITDIARPLYHYHYWRFPVPIEPVEHIISVAHAATQYVHEHLGWWALLEEPFIEMQPGDTVIFRDTMNGQEIQRGVVTAIIRPGYTLHTADIINKAIEMPDFGDKVGWWKILYTPDKEQPCK